MSDCSYPCTLRDCDGTASLTLDPAHYEGDQIVGDRLVYRCPDCAHIWDEHGRPMGRAEDKTMSEQIEVRRNATLLGVEWGRWVTDEFGDLSPHPEFPHRHTAKIMLAEGDRLPDITAKTRVTVIFESGDDDD